MTNGRMRRVNEFYLCRQRAKSVLLGATTVKFLTKTEMLWASFISTILLTLLFGVIMRVWDFTIIDEMYDPAQVVAHIDAMTPTQSTVHAWMTGTLDVAYPLVYGAFFVGMALRFFGRFGPWLAIPGVAVVPVDLTEGVVQILLLNGHDSVAWLKAYITPLKLGLWFAALFIALVAVGVATSRLIRSRR